jgi:hypothetical protein
MLRRRPTTPTVRAELDRVEQHPPGMTTVVYRRRDAHGFLLYVGVSDWPQDRASGHGHNSLWAEFAASGTNEWFPSRTAALAAETVAIRAERPLFNRYHSAPGARDRLEGYLMGRGRPDLLEAIAGWIWDHSDANRRSARPGATQK